MAINPEIFSGTTQGNAILYLCTPGDLDSNTQSDISNAGTSASYSNLNQTPYYLWLTSIQTGSSLQFVKQTTQTRYAYIPIRRAEMNVQFTAVWPYRLLNQMNQFSEAIRQHYFYALANTLPTPMTFIYLGTRSNTTQSPTPDITGNPMAFTGWVKSAPNGFQRFQSLFKRSFNMQILTQPGVGGDTLTSSVVNNTSFLPSAADANAYGNGWYNVTTGNNPSISGINN